MALQSADNASTSLIGGESWLADSSLVPDDAYYLYYSSAAEKMRRELIYDLPGFFYDIRVADLLAGRQYSEQQHYIFLLAATNPDYQGFIAKHQPANFYASRWSLLCCHDILFAGNTTSSTSDQIKNSAISVARQIFIENQPTKPKSAFLPDLALVLFLSSASASEFNEQFLKYDQKLSEVLDTSSLQKDAAYLLNTP